MRILCGCEESQTICKAFRAKGHEAYSCDLQPCSGGHPEWHIQGDVLEQLDKGWDMGIFNPPCTHLAVSGARWFKEKEELQNEAIIFFFELVNAPIEKICIENPVGIMSTLYRKPDQYIQPYEYGHPETKKTCLWRKGLPALKPTNNVYDKMMKLPKRERAGTSHATIGSPGEGPGSYLSGMGTSNERAMGLIQNVS
jgi:hypothetical protein